jgi:RHS repeat-associated protein
MVSASGRKTMLGGTDRFALLGVGRKAIQSAAPSCRASPYVLVLLCLASSLPALAAHRDPAPLPGDVVSRLVAQGASRRAESPGIAALNHHLDELTGIAAGTSTSQRMLLAAKRNDLTVARAQLHEEFEQVRARLQRLRLPGKVRAFDQFVSQVDERFDRLDRALVAVDASTPGEGGQALAQLRAELEALHGRIVRHELTAPSAPIPTLHEDVPLPRQPYTPSTAKPRYLAAQPPAQGYLFASLSPPPIPPQAASCGYTSADLAATPDAPQSADIQALAAKLGYSPTQIFQYVSNQIAFQPYYGSLKGALATLYSSAGGPTDQASLLIALLRASNVPARYVTGQVQVLDRTSDPTGGRIARWVGAKSYQSAAQILAQGRFSIGIVNNSSSQPIGAQLQHVWVEACVPYGHYRGASIDASGERWIALDPSFKDQAFQPGIATSVSFDYTGYLAHRTNGADSLPQEAYAQQVEAAVRAIDPNLALEDVPFTGALNPLALDLLPASLPFEVVAFTNWSGTSSPEASQLPAAHRYRFAIGVGMASPASVYLPDVALSRVTLSFKGATGADQTALSSWYGDGNVSSAVPCTINVVPVLLVGGVDQGISGASVGLCAGQIGSGKPAPLTLTLSVYLDEVSSNPANAVTYNNISAANWHALQAYSFQASDKVLGQHAASVISTVNSTANPNASAASLDATEGEFLNLIGLKYLRYVSDALTEIGGLNAESGQSGNHLGLASTQAKVVYAFDLPYAVNRTGFLVDFPGFVSRSVDLSSGTAGWATFRLAAYAQSAYESYVWQENALLDAVSTVRGLQFANETGIGTVQATSGNFSTVRSQLSVYPGSSPDDCTYTGTQYPRCLIDSTSRPDSLQTIVNLGYTVTLPKALVQYGNWLGYLHADERQGGNPADPRCPVAILCIGMAINQLAGGYTVNTQVPESYSAPINTGDVNQPEASASVVNQNATSGGTNSTTYANGTNLHTVTAGDPVNMATGNLYHSATDFSIKGRGGLGLAFSRFYNSRNPADGPLGFGWTHSFNHVVKLYGVEGGLAKLSWIDGAGGEKFFATASHTNGNVTVGTTIANPSGIFVTFQRQTNGTYTIREKNGRTYTFASATGPSGTPGPGTPPVSAQLLSITDRNGNTLTLSYSSACGNNLCSVTDALGRALTFAYTGNHISQIQDFSGRQVQYVYDGNANLTAVKNALAISGTQNPVSYSYYGTTDGASLNHLMKQYTLARGNGMYFEYYANGRVFRHTVVLLNGTLSPDQVNTFTYNDFRRESIQTNERAGQRHFFFDPNGNPVQILEENGAQHDYTYDCTDPTQPPGSAGCANPFNRLSKRDPFGFSSQFAYNANGDVTQVTTPRGANTQYFDFNAFDAPRRIEDGNGHWTILRYDTRGNLTDEIHTVLAYTPPSCSSSECAIPPAADILSWTVNGYDAFGNLTSTKRVRDVAGQISNNTATSTTGPLLTFGYDANALNITSMARIGLFNNASTASTVNSASPTYDTLGREKTGVDAHWYPTQSGYDALDRLAQGTDAFGNLRTFQFDPNNNPTGQTLTLPVNGTPTLIDSSSILYDDTDRESEVTDAGGGVTAYGYDAASNLISIESPDGYLLSFNYDAANRVVGAYDEEDHLVSSARDAAGKIRIVTDPNGNTTTRAYWDASRDGRLKTLTYPRITNNGSGPSLTSGRAVQYDYDAVGNVISMTEIPAGGSGQANRTSSTSYDELNRPVRIVGPQYIDVTFGAICPVTLNTYDTLGRITQVAAGYTPSPCTNPVSDVTTLQRTYGFDDFSHKIRETDALSRSWVLTYDVHDNLVTQVDPKNQTTNFTWAQGEQLLTRQEVTSGRTATYQRNALGQALQITYPEVNYALSYDAFHRLFSVTDSRGGKTLTYGWSPGGWLNSIGDSEGHDTNFLYDPVGRLSGITAPNGDTVNVSFDPGGRLIERDLPNGISSRYQWNEDNSLREIVNRNAASSILTQHDYAFDGVGERLSEAENIGGSLINYGYSYDTLKRLVQITNGTAAQQENDAYDPLGNRIAKSIGQSTTITAYKFDAANELTEIHSGSLTGPLLASLSYDLDGNISNDGTRAYTWDDLNQLKQVTSGSTSVAYHYDSEGRRIEKIVGSTATQWLYNGTDIYAQYGSGWTSPTALYTDGGTDLPLIRAAVSGGTFGQATYYYQDGLGSVVGLSDNTDNMTQVQRFDAWGNLLSGTIPPSAQYGYTGREPDETGLIYYRARYYAPGIARFVSEDPLGLAARINLYAYTNNNPINANDPTGEDPNIPYGTLNDARIAAGQYNAALTLYSSDNRERGSLIYQQGIQYFYTEAVTGSAPGINHVTQADYNSLLPSIPAGATVLETSHSHPPSQVGDTFYGQFPSGDDNRFAKNYPDQAGTLGLVNGSVLTYPAGPGTIAAANPNGSIYLGDPRNINEAPGVSVIAPPTPLANPNAIDVPLPTFDLNSAATDGTAASDPNSPNNNALASVYRK